MKLLLSSSRIKPVKITITSAGKQCVNLQMLKENFSIKDIATVNDSRLTRWLMSIGEHELADTIEAKFATPEDILGNQFEFLKLIFGKVISNCRTLPEAVTTLIKTYPVCVKNIVNSDKETAVAYYRSKPHLFKDEEWLDILYPFAKKNDDVRNIIASLTKLPQFNVESSNTDLYSSSQSQTTNMSEEDKLKKIQQQLQSKYTHTFTGIRHRIEFRQLLEKVKRFEPENISIEMWMFIYYINKLIENVEKRKQDKSYVYGSYASLIDSEYRWMYQDLYKKSLRAMFSGSFTIDVCNYIKQNRLKY